MSESIKERMLKSLSSGYSLLGIERKHFHHQVNGLLTSVGNKLIQRGWHELWESEAHARGKLVTIWPLCLCWASKNRTSLVNLIGFVISWEERSEHVVLSHHGTTGKDVDW